MLWHFDSMAIQLNPAKAEQYPDIVEKLEAKLTEARIADPNWKFFSEE